MIIFLLTLNRSNYFELSSELASRYKIWASSFVSKFNLAKTYGKNGKLTCRWVYGMALINNGKEFTYTWSKEDFYIVDKPSSKIDVGSFYYV